MAGLILPVDYVGVVEFVSPFRGWIDHEQVSSDFWRMHEGPWEIIDTPLGVLETGLTKHSAHGNVKREDWNGLKKGFDLHSEHSKIIEFYVDE